MTTMFKENEAYKNILRDNEKIEYMEMFKIKKKKNSSSNNVSLEERTSKN